MIHRQETTFNLECSQQLRVTSKGSCFRIRRISRPRKRPPTFSKPNQMKSLTSIQRQHLRTSTEKIWQQSQWTTWMTIGHQTKIDTGKTSHKPRQLHRTLQLRHKGMILETAWPTSQATLPRAKLCNPISHKKWQALLRQYNQTQATTLHSEPPRLASKPLPYTLACWLATHPQKSITISKTLSSRRPVVTLRLPTFQQAVRKMLSRTIVSL